MLGEIERVHAGSDGIYGQLKIWDELNDEGIEVARCAVERLMRKHGIEGCRNGKTQVTTVPGSNPVAADDLVRRDFTADRPDAVWLSDFTYIRAWQGRATWPSCSTSTRGASWVGILRATWASPASPTLWTWHLRPGGSTRAG
jgi:transposase InsO family protein